MTDDDHELLGTEVTVTLRVERESQCVRGRFCCLVVETGDDLYVNEDVLRRLGATPDPLGRDERGVTRGMREWLRKNPTLKGRNYHERR